MAQRKRIDLHRLLKTICPNCYYQEPENSKLVYPCIVYELEDMPASYADNLPYHIGHVYQLKVIDPDPESAVREAVAKLPRCRFIRPYEADNLHHYVFRMDY